MGAVKTNRRILINPNNRKGALYFTKGADDRAEKELKRDLQRWGLAREPYVSFNNRRKMAGLPMIRRVRS